MDDIYFDNKQLSKLMLKYDFALKILETQLNILIKEFEFNNKYNPVEHIKVRIKSEKSAALKLSEKGYDILCGRQTAQARKE